MKWSPSPADHFKNGAAAAWWDATAAELLPLQPDADPAAATVTAASSLDSDGHTDGYSPAPPAPFSG